MEFEWDNGKNQDNLRKHRISFEDVVAVFTSPMLVTVDDRFDYGEDRWIGIGMVTDIPVVVIWAEPSENVIRIISARKANRQERERYEQFLAQ
jgi:uncharacterized protein